MRACFNGANCAASKRLMIWKRMTIKTPPLATDEGRCRTGGIATKRSSKLKSGAVSIFQDRGYNSGASDFNVALFDEPFNTVYCYII